MKITHGHERGKGSEERGPTFTGPVWADPVLAAEGAPTINTVVFPPGSRTHWHTHERGQILIVTHGSGYVAVRDGDSAAVGAGDVVWFGPDEVHWHGAGPDTLLSHIAISLGNTRWLDAVTEADYAAVT